MTGKQIFEREHLSSTKEIVRWWGRGRGLLNLIVLIYTILFLCVLVLVFEDGWIVFLLPAIGIIFIVINVLFSFGLFLELTAKYLKLEINFDKFGPQIKTTGFLLSVIVIMAFSMYVVFRI